MSKTATRLPLVNMVKEFQCPGCTVGGDLPECGNIQEIPGFEPGVSGGRCENHSAGTMMSGVVGGKFALGLPRGFNRCGLNAFTLRQDYQHNMIRLFPRHENGEVNMPEYDKFNVAVWAMQMGTPEFDQDYLFVRCYQPRSNIAYVDVIQGGSLDSVPNAINVGEFYDEID